MTPYTLRIEYLDGRPDGLAVATLVYRPIRVLHVPRTQLEDLADHPETAGTGVYLLVGTDPAAPHRQKVYVGEADDVFDRLRGHDRGNAKPFWNRTFCVVTDDDELNKGHARFLESELYARIEVADRATLANGNRPAPKRLSRSQKTFMHDLLDDLERILPAFGLDILTPGSSPPVPAALDALPLPTVVPRAPEAVAGTAESAAAAKAPATATKDAPVGTAFRMTVRGRTAWAIATDAGMIVRAGSAAAPDLGRLEVKAYLTRRQEFIADGVLAANAAADGGFGFARDTLFVGGVSEPAAIVNGYNTNGRKAWRRTNDADGRSTNYGDWDDAGRPA